MTGRVFDIQRFSVHDGPGIRTTVFMKGCPLRCKWCHNPEGLSALPQLQFFKESCIGCGACGKREYLSDADKCPAEALKVCGKEFTVDDIVDIALKDRTFYSDVGGVTFSGGECLLQAAFVVETLEKLKLNNIRTAIDTSGYVPWENINNTLSACDLYIYDVKCISPQLHKAYTGSDNSLILENLKKLSLTGKDIWIRVPVIPSFNDNEKEMTAIAEFVSGLNNIEQVTLIPYHKLGVSKYETLGIEYQFDTSLRLSEDKISTYSEIFGKMGLTVK